MSTISFLVGSYSIPSPWAGAPGAHGAGIVAADLDTASGAVHVRDVRSEINPSFLVRAPAGLVWGITEPEKGGEFLAFRQDASGGLNPIGRLETGADAPCHVAIHPTRQFAFVAHYHGGVVALLALDGAGKPAAVLDLVRPPATVGDEDRSSAPPRPHAVLPLSESELMVTDAGRDHVLLYRLVTEAARPRLELLQGLALRTGTGPRHLGRAPGQSVVYVSNQNSSGVSVIERVGGEEGPCIVLRRSFSDAGLGRAVAVPSEIAVHPSGGACYLANRTDDSLSIFSIEAESSDLQPRGAVDVMGRNPRHFAIAPGGEWLVAASQDSDELTIFHIEDDGRRLVWTGQRVAVASPTVIAF
jgi:6-phosphogluconolactonase